MASAEPQRNDVTPIRTIQYGDRGEVHVFADAEMLAHAAASAFLRVAQAGAATGRAFVALSGGSTPKRMGELLAGESYREHVPWEEIEFFWGDERWVPEESDESNAGVARRTFLNQVLVVPSRINAFPTHISDPAMAAEIYTMQLKTVFGETDSIPRFDLIFLGMGDDGHTASLFPGTEAVHEQERWVVAHHVPKLDATRLTLTPPVLNAGQEVIFLVGGAGKAETLARVLDGPIVVDELPSQVIRPDPGKLMWYVDEAAAAKLAGGENE